MDPELMRAAQGELRPGERLQWAGRPGRGALARTQLATSLFGVPFLAFSLFWIATSYRITSAAGQIVGFADLFWLFGVPFVLVGLWMTLAAPRAFLRAPSMVYGLTDQRVFVRSGRKVRSWGPGDLNALERRERGDGSGDIVFRTDLRSGSKGTTITRHGFYGIARVREVEAMIAKLRETAR